MSATRFFRISAANIGPNRFHRNRTISWLMSLGQEIFDVSKRQRVSHVHHHDQTDDLRRAVEISERIAHGLKLPRRDALRAFCLTTPSVPKNDGARSPRRSRSRRGG